MPYTPQFHHVPWIDGFHRVAAGTDNGMNIRFQRIEQEFRTISGAVTDIDEILADLGAVVRAPVTIGLVPALLRFGGNNPWSDIKWSLFQAGQTLGTFVDAEGQDSFGVLPLDLPNGARLLRLKVRGEQQGAGTVTTELFQESRTPPFTRTPLIQVVGLSGAGTDPTDIPGTPVFDGAANVYYLLVKAEGVDATSIIRLRAFLITFQEKEAA